MILRNNYFGSFTHFSTLYEYLEKRRLGQPLGDPVDLQYREGSVSIFCVNLNPLSSYFRSVKLIAGLPWIVNRFWIDRHAYWTPWL